MANFIKTLSRVLSYAYANGLSATRSYDLQGRLQSQQLQDTSNTVIDQRSYSYDKNSNLTNIDTNIEDNAYLYDKRDRLTRDTIDSNSPFDFTYDQNDNRLTKQRQDLSLNEFFEQQEKSNRLSVVAAVKPGLTPIEDLPNRDMVYNDVGRLYQLIEAGTLKAEYLYNDSGQRTRKTVYQGDGISIDSITIYHYDQQGYLITETTETGALIKDYIWQQGLHPVAQIDASMPAQAGMPSEGIIYLHTDHLLTNRLATDATREVIWRWEGEAFGNTPASGSVSVNLRFPGQYYDAETNLHYNHFRYYDPELGRYITSDPIGIIGGMNTYGYVYQNPIMYYDPDGLVWTAGQAGVSWDEFQELNRSGAEDPCGCFAKVIGIETAAGTGIAASGLPIIPKRFTQPGTSGGTSIASAGLSKALPQRLPIRVPAPTLNRPSAMSNKLGRVLGRWIPGVGWILLTIDASELAACLEECEEDECKDPK